MDDKIKNRNTAAAPGDQAQGGVLYGLSLESRAAVYEYPWSGPAADRLEFDTRVGEKGPGVRGF
jgi:hypothetical protein